MIVWRRKGEAVGEAEAREHHIEEVGEAEERAAPGGAEEALQARLPPLASGEEAHGAQAADEPHAAGMGSLCREAVRARTGTSPEP